MANPPPSVNPRRHWREGVAPTASAGAKGPSRWRKIFALLAVMSVLAGVIVALIIIPDPPPKPYFVPLFITEYDAAHWPANSLAEQDREALLDGGYFPEKSANAFGSQLRSHLVQELAVLKNRSSKDTVVVYLSAYARAGENNDVLVLPGDAKVDDPGSGLSLREVLGMVRACPAKHKLLILDLARPLADPRLGVLANDISTRIHDTVLAQEPDYLVLCTCSPGEVSLVSEDLGRSVFGYYLEQGLRGAADGYGVDAKRDRRVSARELAEFTKARVDRWASRMHDTSQTPVLLGSAKDFELIALKDKKSVPSAPSLASAEYPPALAEAWKTRDQWRNGDGFRTAPRQFRQLEAAILRADQEWRGGMWNARQDGFKKDLADLNLELDQARAMTHPKPRSLAAAVALGEKPAGSWLVPTPVADALNKLLFELNDKKLLTLTDEKSPQFAEKKKLLDAFPKAIEGKPDFDLALAVFQAAVGDPNPTPEEIRLLDELLKARQPRPGYVETLFLRRLAELDPKQWPLSTVRQALEVVDKGEKAANQPSAFRWVQSLLEAAAQERHDAEVLLFSRGSANAAAVQDHWLDAGKKFDTVLYAAGQIQQAQRRLDEAFALLPAYLIYLEDAAGHEKSWLAAAEAAEELWQLLAAAPATTSPQDLIKSVDQLRMRTDLLDRSLGDLRRPFQRTNVDRLLRDSQSETNLSPAGTWREINALLVTPLLTAKDRDDLWKAARKLSRQLCEQTLKLDEEDDRKQQRTAASTAYDRERLERAEWERAERRAQLSIALLKLGGLAPAEIDRLEAARQQASQAVGRPGVWNPVADALRRAWAEQFPAQLASASKEIVQDRLGRILHPVDPSPLLDEAEKSPTYRLRTQDAHALWTWLADRYRYEQHESRGPLATTFFEDAVREYRRVVEPPPAALVRMRTIPAGDGLRLTSAVRSATCTLVLDLPASAKEAPKLEYLTDGAWLQVKEDKPTIAGGSMTVHLKVELKDKAERSPAPRPEGFTVQARLNGRTFHHQVKVQGLPTPDDQRLALILSAGKNPSESSLSELRLRPVKNPQEYFLFVKNPTGEEKEVVVELYAGAAPEKMSDKKLKVGAGKTEPVRFGETPPPPNAPLPELKGPLQLRLLDAKTNERLDEQVLTVTVASPRVYVSCKSPQFFPAARRLEVRLQATAPLGEAACIAELVLPPFLTKKDAKLRGELPPDGELVLFAEGLDWEGIGNVSGPVYVTVDGYERAFLFHPTFVREGDPGTPPPVGHSAIRLLVEPLAKAGPEYVVPMNVDNAPAGSRIELEFGRAEGDGFLLDQRATRVEGRQVDLRFSPQGPNGALLFSASIKDWSVPFNTTGHTGLRSIRARLVSANEATLAEDTKTVMLDGSPPEKPRFLGEPKPPPKGRALEVRATGMDKESGIRKALFYLKKPVDGKLPPNSTPDFEEESKDLGKTTWSMRIPEDKAAGRVDIIVKFINGVGLESEIATTAIEFVDAGPNGQTNQLGTIKGKVTLGDRPREKLDVLLKDEKGNDVDKTKTDKAGEFVFEKVKPGKYKVSSASDDVVKRKAEAEVTIKAGETQNVELKLTAVK